MVPVRTIIGVSFAIAMLASLARGTAAEPGVEVVLQDDVGLFDNNTVKRVEYVLSRLGRQDRLYLITRELTGKEWQDDIEWRHSGPAISESLRTKALGDGDRDGLVLAIFVLIHQTRLEPPAYETLWIAHLESAGSLAKTYPVAPDAQIQKAATICWHFREISLSPGRSHAEHREALAGALLQSALDVESSLRMKPEPPSKTDPYRLIVAIEVIVIPLVALVWVIARFYRSRPRTPPENPFVKTLANLE